MIQNQLADHNLTKMYLCILKIDVLVEIVLIKLSSIFGSLVECVDKLENLRIIICKHNIFLRFNSDLFLGKIPFKP